MADSSSDSDNFLTGRIGRRPLRASHSRVQNYGAEEVTEKIHTLASTLQVIYKIQFQSICRACISAAQGHILISKVLQCTVQMGNVAFCANQKRFWEIDHTAFELQVCGLLHFYTAALPDSNRMLLEIIGEYFL